MLRKICVCLFVTTFIDNVTPQNTRRVGKFQEVFAWKQMTYDIDGNLLLQDRFDDLEVSRGKRQADRVFFDNNDGSERVWDQTQTIRRPKRPSPSGNTRPVSNPTVRPMDEAGRFFIQYNNVPMGAEKVGNRLFIALPRRRYGIPSTLNYVDLNRDSNTRSPALKPFPNIVEARTLTSIYRTRADECGRLWAVDTGLLEIPGNPQQMQQPAIVIFDLSTDSQILRYPFKTADIPAANTPTGLASITIDINGDCSNAYAYVPDLTTFGLIVYSLKDNDSWRLSHNYFHFSPTAGNLNIAGQSFQWGDGIFSVTLTDPMADGCRLAYFHPMISTQEFSVSTCVLKNRTITSRSDYFTLYSYVGERGDNSQCTMHGLHQSSSVIFFADIGRDAVSCWNTGKVLNPSNVAVLAQDSKRMSYPSDLHVTGNEVWVIANTLPRFGYSTLDTNDYNFYVYKAEVYDLISGTVCQPMTSSGIYG